ncbi:unnamed protein product [Absidia cylindrospora]
MAPQQKRQKNAHNKKPEEKDSEEKKLESLLFGGLDDIWEVAGKEHNLATEDTTIDGEDDSGSVVNDDQEDTFFFDAGPVMNNDTTAMDESEVDYEATDESESESDKDSDDDNQPLQQKAAWKDDNDSRLEISLAGTSRLRKLRKHENEETVSGMEYERRLRKQ